VRLDLPIDPPGHQGQPILTSQPNAPGATARRGHRRGARHPSLVPHDVRVLLENGGYSSNHMEQIAMDMGNLLAHSFPKLKHRSGELRGIGLVERLRTGGRIVSEAFGPDAPSVCAAFESDTVRGWGAMAIGEIPEMSLAERFALIRPFADDDHFAVREWAWLSVRPHIRPGLRTAIQHLVPWTSEPSDRLRRFASEVTRPRGVWSTHLPELKADPSRALVILHPLRSDSSAYVQASVGNWLNDVAKSKPDWVRATTRSWLSEATSPYTHRICKRGCRSL
jgi:3-methyladenine DNA glycosylase AlkC